MISPFVFPVSADNYNFVSAAFQRLRNVLISSKTGVVVGSVTTFAVISWWVVPEDKWLRSGLVCRMKETANEAPSASI